MEAPVVLSRDDLRGVVREEVGMAIKPLREDICALTERVDFLDQKVHTLYAKIDNVVIPMVQEVRDLVVEIRASAHLEGAIPENITGREKTFADSLKEPVGAGGS